jgi:glycosyltransferase involved in cell wall biosynthesis
VSNWPDVAVIMPVLNEEKYLESSVRAIFDQNYPGSIRVILAIGPCTDKTLNVANELVQDFKSIKIINSPTGRTPESLNLAIAECKEDFIVRVDAHSELSEKYIETAISTILKTGADNVGGIMAAQGNTGFEKAVATAMTSTLGVGNAAFHTGGSEGPAESVYLGVFRKSALKRVGGYDDKFTRAQDWEMNHRIRSTGGLIWFNPELKVTYRPRSSLQKLAKQYFQYGTWRREVMREHPETIKRKTALRYFAPPTALVGILVGLLSGTVGLINKNFLVVGLLAPGTYLIFTIISSMFLAKKAKLSAVFLPLVLATMHISWGSGFLIGNFIQKFQSQQ